MQTFLPFSDFEASARVLDVRSPRFPQRVEETRAASGSAFSICDITLPSEISN